MKVFSFFKALPTHVTDPFNVDEHLGASFVNKVKELVSAHPSWVNATSSFYDAERGSLRIFLADGADITLAVSDSYTAEQVASAVTLGGAKSRLTQQDDRLVIMVDCEKWFFTIQGYPALASN